VSAALDAVDLAHRADQVAATLPLYAKKRLMVASALVTKPKLLMLDEPSGGLAPSVVGEVMAAASSLTTEGMAIILVEQAVEASLAVADDVIVLDVGRVALQMPASEVSDVSILRDAYFGRRPV
jgi:branched-chain amino acid transport system ATP-binding protein